MAVAGAGCKKGEEEGDLELENEERERKGVAK